ncbi:hypothetical protein [Streptomyces sp. NPDC058623]
MDGVDGVDGVDGIVFADAGAFEKRLVEHWARAEGVWVKGGRSGPASRR